MSPTPTVLVADDDQAIRTVLSHALGRAGFDVRTTGNASTLWQLNKAIPFFFVKPFYSTICHSNTLL